MMYKIYDDENHKKLLDDTVQYKTGLIERDFKAKPCGMMTYAPKSTITPIPRSDWSAIIKEKKARKSTLTTSWDTGDGGSKILSLDQNGQGYCWAYSTGGSIMAIRAFNNQPYVRLSPHATACIIKNYRDEGGDCTTSLDFATKSGYASEKLWPQKSMSRSNDTPALRENMKLHLVTEWDDLPDNLSKKERFELQATYLLMDLPVITDLNWWGHSVFDLELVEIEPGSFGTLKQNSWGESWETLGRVVLREDKTTYDNAVVPRVDRAAAA